ncbi:hypothetical protein A5643_00490 [Mycobacterium sp. 1274756.6]|nr:hypothetical protein A5643_00490 [Mycobacterium sp. 1274756.6]
MVFAFIVFGILFGPQIALSDDTVYGKLIISLFIGALAAFLAFALYAAGSREWLVAGVLWLQKDNVWVSLYELTDVSVSAGGGGQIFTLTDSAGRTVSSVNVRQMQRHQLLWDLVYNGMLYSTVNGQLRPGASARRFFSLPAGPAASMRSIEDFARIGEGGRPTRAEPVIGRDEVNIKRRGANIRLAILGGMAAFFGFVALVLVPDPELRPGSLFLIPLTLVLATWAAMGYYLRYDRGPLSRNKKGGLRRVPQTPVIIVMGLLLSLCGGFIFADNVFVGSVMGGGGLVVAVGQVRRALAGCEERAPAGRHAAGEPKTR